jgi:hypothetical protein
MYLPGSLLACTFVSPCLGDEPKVRVVIIISNFSHKNVVEISTKNHVKLKYNHTYDCVGL